MRSRRSVVPIGALSLVMLLAGPWARGQTPPPPPPPPLTPLPPPLVPAGNLLTTDKINLGQTLFWDEQLSSTRTVACGSCHHPTSGGSDPRSIRGSSSATHPGADGVTGTPDDAIGSPGVVQNDASSAMVWSDAFGLKPQVTSRLAPSPINAAYAPLLFWDGRAGQEFRDPVTGAVVLSAGGALENQASAPPVSSAEMGHLGRDWSDVVERVGGAKPLAVASHVPNRLASWIGGRDYSELFRAAFGDPTITASRIAMAIASYERNLVSNQAPFDSVIAGTTVLAPQEAAGMQLFGQLACARCHGGALTSDNQFHYTGVRPAAEDSGRAAVTLQPADLGAFKTPTLRNVALRPSFMHDGRFATLAEVVAFYNRGGDFSAPNKSPLIQPLGLAAPQQAQLVAFLSRPLTDPRVANGVEPFDRPMLYSEGPFVPEILAGGVAGSGGAPPEPVALEPPLRGNPAFTVGVYGALGGANAVLVIDDAEPPTGAGIPGTGSLARAEVVLHGSGVGDGWGSATLPLPNDEAAVGTTFYGRWYVTDPGAASGVAASPAFRFTLFAENGGTVATGVDAVDPTLRSVRLRPGYPNPFRDRNTVRFDLPRATRAELRVYDVRGRLVRRLVSAGSAMPGVYSVVWDGRDDRGREAPAGVYFYRLDTEFGSRSARIVRLK
jgi:cytochrome c peroxidase